MIRFRIFFQTNSYVCNMKWKYSFIVLLSALIACNNNTESKDSKEVNERQSSTEKAYANTLNVRLKKRNWRHWSVQEWPPLPPETAVRGNLSS